MEAKRSLPSDLRTTIPVPALFAFFNQALSTLILTSPLSGGCHLLSPAFGFCAIVLFAEII
ncbi:hypothetical protein Vadar_005267 [Vaccinium darrowii]|uniref:Uncharacterized protein n=1 Tax=Vaccinium darrowii TaxID=229202 RepID=A0ACB7Z2N6_9ERIC|nr:hypothetical protein Vadar_005267 [Vaccinium darrowii]